MTTTALDTGLIERFAGQIFGYYVGGMTAYMIGIGHRTGLFEAGHRARRRAVLHRVGRARRPEW